MSRSGLSSPCEFLVVSLLTALIGSIYQNLWTAPHVICDGFARLKHRTLDHRPNGKTPNTLQSCLFAVELLRYASIVTLTAKKQWIKWARRLWHDCHHSMCRYITILPVAMVRVIIALCCAVAHRYQWLRRPVVTANLFNGGISHRCATV